MKSMGKVFISLFLPLCLAATTTARAEPDMPGGAELLAACEHASNHGYDNTLGMLCIWYITPCDCTVNKSPSLPRVCLPPDVHHDVLAQRVMQALRERRALLELSAEEAAAIILSEYYPCG